MDKKPLLSIITINYNDKKGLLKTFESIFKQTYQEFEYIVIDGGSTDGSKELVDENADKIDCWVSEPDKGIYNAMNKGIKAANGKYLNFMNAGDSFYQKNTLENSINFLKSDKSLYYGNFLDEKTNITSNFKKELDFKTFYYATISHQSSFIKRELFSKYFMYNENNKVVSDWEFFIRIICQFNETYKFIPLVISNYEGGGMSSLDAGVEMIELHKKERKQVLNKYFSAYEKDYLFQDDAIYLVKQLRRIGFIQFFNLFGLFKNL